MSYWMRLENDSRGDAVKPMLDVKMRVMKLPSGSRANVWLEFRLSVNCGGSRKVRPAARARALLEAELPAFSASQLVVEGAMIDPSLLPTGGPIGG